MQPVTNPNHTISVQTLTTLSGIRTFSTTASGIAVYLNQTQEQVATGASNEGVACLHRMLANPDCPTLKVGDRITDESDTVYDVR